MKSSVRTTLIWVPRVLCILYALFISIFALDAFSPDRALGQNLLALLMHLIPTAVILVVLAVSWRWPWIGGILYVAFGILYIVWAGGRFPWPVYLTMSGPLFLTGILFLIGWGCRKELAGNPAPSAK